MTRVLFAERISQDRESSGSIEAQDAKLTAHFEHRSKTEDLILAGKAVDRSVSGGINMFDRPQLGEWLNEEGRESWDELWVTTQDRLSRNDIHFLAFVFKMIEWGKVLVVLDDPTLDLHSAEGRLIAHAKAYAPHKELERIKSRVKDSHELRRHMPVWHGGVPPYGYTTEKKHFGDRVRKVLVLDEHAVSVLHDIRRWLVDEGVSLLGVAKRLNERGEPTVKDYWRLKNGLPTGGSRNREKTDRELWSASGLKRTLSSEALLGVKRSGGMPLYNVDGAPLTVTEAVFTQHEFDELQTALARRSQNKGRKNGQSLLAGIAFCAKCKGPAYRVVIHKQKKMGERVYKYYRCAASHGGVRRCKGVNMDAEHAESIAEWAFLEERGADYVPEKVFIQGYDHTAELEDIKKRISRLREDRELGAYDEDPAYYAQKMKEYTSRMRELEQLPQKKSEWIERDTAETYGEAWANADLARKRQLLLDAGVRMEITSPDEYHVIIPPKGTPMGDESRKAAESFRNQRG